MNEFFRLEEASGCLILTMQAPGNNLMTGEFFAAYEDAMERLQLLISERTDITGLIICGAGRHFSVGADVESLIARSDNELHAMGDEDILPEGHLRQKGFLTFLHDLPFPTVSVVSGFCIGSGCEIAANCHFRICEKNARIGQPESTFGILPALGGIARTIEICGLQRAAAMILTGKLFSAEEAYALGWADVIVPKKGGMTLAKELISYLSTQEYFPERSAEHFADFLESRGEVE